MINTLAVVGATLGTAYYVGRAARRIHLPSLIGYMILGVLLGPSLLNVLNTRMVEDLGFVTEIALGLVAFSIGIELRLDTLKAQGKGIISIILVESFAAFALVAAAVYLLTRDLPMALIFGAMAPASAPAGTVAVIQECRAKGTLTKALYAVVGFDDGLAIFIFGFAFALAKGLLTAEAGTADTPMFSELLVAGREIGVSLAVGGGIGFVLSPLCRRVDAKRDLLILVFAATFLGAGLSEQFHLSLILTNMAIGFVLANRERDPLLHDLSSRLLDIMPVLFILFFALAGAHLDIAALPSLGLLGSIYILARSAGLIGGARLGALFGQVDAKVRKYIGLGILSQAGVAIGLSLIVQREFSQIDSPHAAQIGVALLTTVTSTSIFFEFIGPILTKFALTRAGEIPKSTS